MFDFDVLLESIYPHKQFTEFLRCEKPEMLPYLAIIRKAKLLWSKQDDLEQLKLNEDLGRIEHTESVNRSESVLSNFQLQNITEDQSTRSIFKESSSNKKILNLEKQIA